MSVLRNSVTTVERHTPRSNSRISVSKLDLIIGLLTIHVAQGFIMDPGPVSVSAHPLYAGLFSGALFAVGTLLAAIGGQAHNDWKQRRKITRSE
jgi:hypothetical protein